MSKHKSEVLTAKVQLKVNFSQADISKIRTLPTAFQKCSENLYDGKLKMAASDIMHVRPLICVVEKHPLQY